MYKRLVLKFRLTRQLFEKQKPEMLKARKEVLEEHLNQIINSDSGQHTPLDHKEGLVRLCVPGTNFKSSLSTSQEVPYIILKETPHLARATVWAICEDAQAGVGAPQI